VPNSKADDNADRKALERQGAAVRARLARDSSVYRVPVETAEVHVVADFLSAAECARFRGMVDQVAQPSSTFDQARQSTYRTSYSGDVERHDPFVQMIERRIDDLLGIDSSCGETVQGQRYSAGQEFLGHYDWFDTQAPYWPGEIIRGGQRSWTAMIYLNDVEAGGVTEFPRLGISVPPQQGTLLCWNNARTDGTPNDQTIHAARPVERGVKYVITKWYRTRTWR
jgi:prolyl 4-hydroxylase